MFFVSSLNIVRDTLSQLGLEGKVAVISGRAGGIGESTPRLFSKHGARVIIADIRDDLGESVCKDLGPETAFFVHCDVSSGSDVEKAINTAIGMHGKLDKMVNNAAIVEPLKAKLLDNDKADFERVVSVNLAGSVSSSVGGVASHAYTSSKHGVVGLTRNVATELGRYGIRVNCLSPYFILSPLSREFFNVVRNGRIRVYSNLDGVSLRREDGGETAVFLGSDESKYISGHNLAVDGGFTTINPAFGLLARA
ncbi:hypothetical protein ACJRO7_016729 [Eucalyptus globulus]|uniref:Uncharacterized protein n=1 Tax=Eucalyptus globulus TaxID=34317 RepID=A0ABD3L938_EUCGL